ncbi:NAD(P)-dependent oxidoreductase [Alicyclobacillus shizuokensis]|uniref:NAD(P)-dependent oxidoreductase n=1 Tax=Alicyclobacillus shizuokensis TaxID=392014 RepID=UPI00082D5EF2|nr:NAD(P)-dependent oxidoreductase [Alicyclobacillus shizuokensis]
MGDIRKQTIGFLGLGAMGLPMATRLCKAGYSLNVVRHRRPQPVQQLETLGAKVVRDVAEMIEQSDVVMTILPSDREMESSLLQEDVLFRVRPGLVLVEMTSGSKGVMKRVDEEFRSRGASVLDAPVSGGTSGAENGTLTIMAGGSPAVIEAVRDILGELAANVIPVGDVGDGKAVKAINQMLAGIHMLATVEAIQLARKLNLDMSRVLEVVSQSSGASWIFTHKSKDILTGNDSLGFKMNLMIKDLGIALSDGASVSMPLASLARSLYLLASHKFGEVDFSAVSKLFDAE